MRQNTKNDRNQGSNATKNFFWSPTPQVPKSPTQMGSLSAKTRAKNSHAWAPLTGHFDGFISLDSLDMFQYVFRPDEMNYFRAFSNSAVKILKSSFITFCIY